MIVSLTGRTGMVHSEAGNLTNKMDNANNAALALNTFRRMLVLKYTTVWSVKSHGAWHAALTGRNSAYLLSNLRDEHHAD